MSNDYFNDARGVIAGGVNSPVRAFGSVGGEPVFIARAKGARTWAQDGREFIDYVGSWGPMILGHADDDVLAAVTEVARNGLSFGAPTVLETELARRVRKLVPSMELVRMVSSGTEATMSAIRLARGFTGRAKIVKFEGCYHGHADSLLVKAGSGALTLGVPGSAGVPPGAAADTLTAPFNELEPLHAAFAEHGEDITAIIVEPIAGNMNFVTPVDGFLEGLRELCDRHGAVLIFDEVMTGFRVAAGGAQALYGVRPDLTTLGKVVGGGMPVGVFGGRKDIMETLAPLGPVYQAGTLSGNPVAMAAGIATLDKVARAGVHDKLGALTGRLTEGMSEAARAAGIPFYADYRGGMFGLFFGTNEPVRHFSAVKACDGERFNAFFHGMLERGFYFAPSSFEAGFVSLAHTDDDIDATIAAAREVFAGLAG